MASEKDQTGAELAKSEEAVPSPDSSSVGEASSPIHEKALLRKLDLKLLPPLTLLYLLSFLDRSNAGNQYLTGLTLYFIGYVLFEIPCNIILKRTSPRLWLPTLTLAWGIIATLMGVVTNYGGFLATRFFLGASESGLFPGVVFYLSMWYKRNEQHYRVALFFSAASLAGAFGGILAWVVQRLFIQYAMKLNLSYTSGQQEGLLTVVVAVVAYFFVYNYPATAEFLTPEEREYITFRLKNDNDATRDELFSWPNVLKAIKDPKVWLYGLGFHTMSLPLYTLSLFLPSIIKDLGYSAAQAQLMSVPPYAVAFVLTISTAIFSERLHRRAPFIVGSSCLAIIGYIILLSQNRAGVSYFGTILAAGGIYPATAIVLAWPANNVSGQTKRATANAMQISIGNLGAVLGTQLYRTETSPRYFLGHSFALGYLIANTIVVTILWRVLKRANEKKVVERENQNLGVLGEVGDAEGDFLGDEDPRWVFQL
ncbi:hypothetical protein FQN50_004720 [Emmonsiellopsis sp. PD_5]|nr:hypothetical protein FQN50_004720 [Emmonsiellopsis sp. PD_5]